MPKRDNAPVVIRDEAGNITSHEKLEKESLEARAARKAKAGFTKLPEPDPELVALSIEELNKRSDELDVKRAEIMVEKKKVHAARVKRLAMEHAAYYGLTAEEYNGIKAKAREDANGDDKLYNQLLPSLLGDARKGAAAKTVQAAITTPTNSSIKAKR